MTEEKFPMPSKIRSTVIELDRYEFIEEESVLNLIWGRVQPWLDELAKDDVRYNDIAFETLLEPSEMDIVKVRVSVNVVEE